MYIADIVERVKTLEASINYLKQYMIVNNTLERKINKHARRYKIAPDVCAWYCNWEDFCEDWCKKASPWRSWRISCIRKRQYFKIFIIKEKLILDLY